VEGRVILDPFAGSGSTVVAAERLGKRGLGLELSPEYSALARRRLEELRAANGRARGGKRAARSSTAEPAASTIHHVSATELLKHVAPGSVDLCISSPPYWNILNQRRTADLKAVRHYGNLRGDVGTIENYEEFLSATTEVFRDVLATLVPGAYCCVIVMDLRKKDRFFPLHSDLAGRLVDAGYVFDDLIIWNRQSEYNNLRPLGFPAVFRMNKVHEYILLLRKPKSSPARSGDSRIGAAVAPTI
jgi:DNA modification methylase